MSINVSNYSGTIGALSILGNLNVSGNVVAGSSMGYIEAYDLTGHTITTAQNNTIVFPTISTNTFSSSVLTVTGVNNTTFTNTSSATISLNVSACVSITSTSGISQLNTQLSLSTNGRSYFPNFQLCNAGFFGRCNSVGMIVLPAGASFTVQAQPASAGVITCGGANTLITVIYIKQLL